MILKRWDLEYEVIDLNEYGINNFAFDLPSAISYMWEAANNNFLILGGDIITVDYVGGYTESDNNWYSEKREPLETLQDAINYLCLYCRNSHLDLSSWKISINLAKKLS